MGSFSDSLERNVERVKQEIDTKIVNYAKTLFDMVVVLSPAAPEAGWSKGEFKNSWYTAFNGYDTTSIATNYDQYGQDSYTRIKEMVALKTFYGKDGFISLANNVPYAKNIEYTGWMKEENANWKGTPPYAPVRIAINLVANK